MASSTVETLPEVSCPHQKKRMAPVVGEQHQETTGRKLLKPERGRDPLGTPCDLERTWFVRCMKKKGVDECKPEWEAFHECKKKNFKRKH